MNASPLNRPAWAHRPTSGKAVLLIIFWIVRPYIMIGGRSKTRQAVLGTLTAFMQMLPIATMVLGCITLAEYLFEIIYIRILATIILFIPGFFFVLPLLTIATSFLSLILSLLVEAIFSEKVNINKNVGAIPDEKRQLDKE